MDGLKSKLIVVLNGHAETDVLLAPAYHFTRDHQAFIVSLVSRLGLVLEIIISTIILYYSLSSSSASSAQEIFDSTYLHLLVGASPRHTFRSNQSQCS